MKALVRIAGFVGKSPWLLAVLALTVAWLVVQPWGNYALNDDWTYAHMAKHIAATGKVLIDVPIAPNAIGQALLGAAVVKIFGFSHTILRILTMLVACAGLWGIDRLISHVVSQKPLRVMALLVIAFNPIYFYSATSYMNELHGWVPAIFATAIWFEGRKRNAAGTDEPVSFVHAVLAGLVAGAVFWTRQTAVLVFPAFVGATTLRLVLLGRWKALARSLPALAATTVVFGGAIYLFFVWAKASGNFRPEFSTRIGNLTKIDELTYEMQAGSALVYETAFFLPLLVLFRWKSERRWLLDLGAIAFLFVGITTKYLFEVHAPSDFWIGPIWSHRYFPFVVNIVYNAGLGPITLDDAFFNDVAKASWPKWVWMGIESVLIFAGVLWSPVCAAVGRQWNESKQSWSTEVVWFGVLLTLGGLVAIIQTHQGEMVDRYYLTIIVGLAVLVPTALSTVLPADVGSYQFLKYATIQGLLVIFCVFGAHDQFRWNDARWKLIGQAMAKGGTRGTVQAGYELNCWNQYERMSPEELGCNGQCRCDNGGFCCVDDRWRVGLTLRPGYTQVAAIQPSYWLADGPPVILGHRGPL